MDLGGATDLIRDALLLKRGVLQNEINKIDRVLAELGEVPALLGTESPSGRMKAPASAAPHGDGAANRAAEAQESGSADRPDRGGSHDVDPPHSKAEETPAPAQSEASAGAGVRLTAVEAAILDCIRREGPRVGNPMLAAVAQRSLNTIINTTERLKRRGVLEQEGSRNGRRLYIAGEPRPVDRPNDGTLAAKLLQAIRDLGPGAGNRVLGEAIDRPAQQVGVLLMGLERQGAIRRVGSTRARSILIVGETDTVANPGQDKPDLANPGQRKPGAPKRRFTEHAELDPENVRGLAPDHPAVKQGRTLFPGKVVEPAEAKQILKSGEHSRKIGDRVTKGPWRGFSIYTLTLEERATCPRSCAVFEACYGNGMPMADRHRHGPELEALLEAELMRLQAQHPGGFVVRLHVLGDFYSVEYVWRWADWLRKFAALHVFGYTAWPSDSEIGKAVETLREGRWERFAVRTSVAAQPGALGPLASTLDRKARGKVDEGIVCPAQTGDTACCGSCGFCWSPSAKDTPVVFMLHGRRGPAQQAPAPAGSRALPEPKRQKTEWPKDRRCQACQKFFKSRHEDEVVCQPCAQEGRTAPPVALGWRPDLEVRRAGR